MLFTTNSIIFFIVTTIVSLFVQDMDLKFSYWLMVLLLYISYVNVHVSTIFYRRLRENPGKIGPRGDQGDQGPKGDDGVCKLEEQCGVVDCNKYTKQVLAQNIDGYAEILDKLKEGVILQGEDAKINKIVNDYMETVLIPICEKTDNLDEYKNLIEKSIDN